MGIFSNQKENTAESIPPAKADALDAASESVKSGAGRPKGKTDTKKRKPGSGLYPREKMAGAPEGETDGSQVEVSPADVRFLGEIARTSLTIADKIFTGKVYRLIRECGEPFLQEKADVYARQVEIGDADKELISKAAEALAVKYPIASAYAPEMVIVGWAATYAMTVTTTLNEIKNVVSQIKSVRGVKAEAEHSPLP